MVLLYGFDVSKKLNLECISKCIMAFTKCIKCGELRFDKKVNRCGSCGSEGYQIS